MPNFPVTHLTSGHGGPLYFYSLHRLQSGASTRAARYRARNTVTSHMLQQSLELLESLTIAEEVSHNPPNWTTTRPAADAGELELLEALTLAEEPTRNPPDLTTTRPAIANDTEELCVICLSEFEIGNTLIQTACKHKFHQECLAKWLENARNCPMCRTDLQGNSDGEQMADSTDEE